MIILFVVAVMISAILPLFINVINSNRAAAYYSAAYKLADSIIEKNRARPFAEIANETNIPIPELPGGRYTLTVSRVPNEGPKQLDLRITWIFNTERNINISTYIAEGGISRW